MYQMVKGDLLQCKADALVNTVNIVGAMGAGIALQFKRKYPQMYAKYRLACQKGILKPGQMWTFDLGEGETPRYIINFPTKRHYRDKSRLQDIKDGLIALRLELMRLEIKTVAIPALGCKNGGLGWGQVRPFIQVTFKDCDEMAFIYEPGD